jgi:hypothetical protein
MDCFGSVEKLPKMSKEQVAEQILKRAVQVKNRKGNN